MVPRAAARICPATLLFIGWFVAFDALVLAETPDRVLVVVNDNSPLSRSIGEYYARRRGVPLNNICHLKASTGEEITREDYDRQIARPIGAFLRKQRLQESIYYIVTTADVP